MVTLFDFVAEILGNVVEVTRIFLLDVAFNDPLSLVSWLTGAAIMAFTMGLMAYLALGAVGELFGGSTGTRRPGRERERGRPRRE